MSDVIQLRGDRVNPVALLHQVLAVPGLKGVVVAVVTEDGEIDTAFGGVTHGELALSLIELQAEITGYLR